MHCNRIVKKQKIHKDKTKHAHSLEQRDRMSTAPLAYPGFPAPAFGGFPAQYGAAAPPGIERQVVPEFVQVPVSQTVMVPQTTYQQRYIQVPVQQTVQVPRVVSSDTAFQSRYP